MASYPRSFGGLNYSPPTLGAELHWTGLIQRHQINIVGIHEFHGLTATPAPRKIAGLRQR